MSDSTEYVLGKSERAARRLEIQDRHFAAPSERLLDELAVKATDRVVELGCGPGGFTRRILKRLGAGGVVVGVDSAAGLQEQAKQYVVGAGPGRFEPRLADVTELGDWLDGADVVCGRAVLHHVPMAEFLLGKLRARLRPGTRVGFIEPDFRSPLARLAYLEATGRTELAPLRVWAKAINELYLARRISPAVGATMGAALATAGYRDVRTAMIECPSDAEVLENMSMYYDEVREIQQALGIMTAEETEHQQRLLRELSSEGLPAVWGAFWCACEV
jgi:ubiquinone/menaquinone biosynthesis C-methylase UbiE